MIRTGRFAMGQSLAQVLAMLTGFAIIRVLAPEDYAIYALAGAFIGITATTCDLGTGGALLAFTGKARSEAERRAAIDTVRSLRRYFTIASVLGAAILLIAHPVSRDYAGPFGIAVLVGIVVAIVAVQSRTVFLKALAAVNQRHDKINRASVLSALLRLSLILPLFLLAAWAVIWLALLAWLAAMWLMAWLLREKIGAGPATADHTMRSAVLRYARPLWLGHAYLVIQSVVPLFALGLAIGASPVAEFAALGRLAQLLVLFKPVTAYILMPYVSRGRFAPRAGVGLVWLTAIALGVTASGWVFADQYLWILGPSYAHLGSFVPIALGVASLNMLSGGCYHLLLAGGYTATLWFATIVGVAAQGSMLLFFPIVDLPSAYLFAGVTIGAQMLINLGLLARAMYSDARSNGVVLVSH